MNESDTAPHTHRVTLLIAITGVLVAAYALWRADTVRDREDTSRDRIQRLESEHAALRAELNAALERESRARSALQSEWRALAEQLADLPRQVKDLIASHDDLRARTERPQRGWSRAEAVYLIELAHRRLRFERDIATAIAALEAADARLASLRDQSFAAARERIAKDLSALRAVPEPDRVGIMARLTAIEEGIDSLPLKGVLVGRRTDEKLAPGESFWQKARATAVNAWRAMFVVRRLNDAHAELVSLEEQTLRRQHLALLTFSARLAALRANPSAYQAALTEMQRWLTQYFEPSVAVTATVQEIDALRAIDIAPPLPDISGAAQILLRAAPAS